MNFSTLLHTNFCGVSFENPLVLASGIWGVTGKNLADAVTRGAGGATTKSLWIQPHKGHQNPVIIADEYFMLNAVGLPDGGIEKAREEIADYRKMTNAPLIANIVAGSPDDFSKIAELAADLAPDIIEINISCPNVKAEFGDLFASGTQSAETFTKIVKSKVGKIPISLKLSPNVSHIGEVAKAAENAGADAITAINTVGPGMRINPELRSPILKNKFGGVSGPAILPIAIAKVFEIFSAVKIPIIATGGITSGRDAIEMIMAGGTLLGIGSAVHFRGADCFSKISLEIAEWCEKEGVKNLREIRGAAH